MSEKSLTHKYIPRIEQTENNLFTEEYYSGTDVEIVMDGKRQGEISYLSFSIQEQLKPLYGYNSRTYDDVAIGNRIVTGNFRVSIRNPERQSTIEEIEEQAQKKTQWEYIEEFNDKEQADKDESEWVEDDPGTEKEDTGLTGEKDAAAKTLEKLGFEINLVPFADYDSAFKDALQRYQRAMNLEATGTLNEQTKKALWPDLPKFPMNPLGKRLVLKDSKLYAGPSEEYPVIHTLDKDIMGDVVTTIEAIDGIWYYIKLPNNVIGYIKQSQCSEGGTS